MSEMLKCHREGHLDVIEELEAQLAAKDEEIEMISEMAKRCSDREVEALRRMNEAQKLYGMGGERELRLMARIAELEKALQKCSALCGHPDPAQACRNVIATVFEALDAGDKGEL